MTTEHTDEMTPWQLEQLEKTKQSRTLHEGVAQHLTGWTVEVQENDCYPENPSISLVNGKYKIGLTTGTHIQRGKVEVSGHWPKVGDHTYTSAYDVHEKSPSINVTLARGYQAIAKEITRRLLPEYFRIYAKIEAKVAGDNEETALRLAQWTQLTESVPEAISWSQISDRSSHPHTASLKVGEHNGSGRMTMRTNSVSFDINSVSVETALRILKAIAEGGSK